jgi:vacuolar-type H+-ATPase subunit C/Vma6
MTGTPRHRPDFDYGNTRLRARRSELLSASDYESLLGRGIDDLLEVVQSTGPRETDRQRLGPLEVLHIAIRTRLGESLEEMRSFYSGGARHLVDMLLSRFDLHNVITLLRARSRPGITAEVVVDALVPMGWLRGPIAREILTAQQLPGVMDVLADLTPDPGQADALRRASAAHERTGDFAGIERSVLAQHAARLAHHLHDAGPAGAALRDLVERETDGHNLLVVLRLRDAVMAGASDAPPPKEALLDGGTLPTRALASLVTVSTSAGVVDVLAGQVPSEWFLALEEWARSGDLAELERSIERSTVTLAARLFVKGDPLAVDVPVAFTITKQVEAHNLRLLAGAAAGAIDAGRLREDLLVVGSLA